MAFNWCKNHPKILNWCNSTLNSNQHMNIKSKFYYYVLLRFIVAVVHIQVIKNTRKDKELKKPIKRSGCHVSWVVCWLLLFYTFVLLFREYFCFQNFFFFEYPCTSVAYGFCIYCLREIVTALNVYIKYLCYTMIRHLFHMEKSICNTCATIFKKFWKKKHKRKSNAKV